MFYGLFPWVKGVKKKFSSWNVRFFSILSMWYLSYFSMSIWKNNIFETEIFTGKVKLWSFSTIFSLVKKYHKSKFQCWIYVEISALSDCFYLRFQEYSILKTILFNTNKQYHLENFFLKILLHFSPFQTILSIFWKSPFLGPKKAHIMGIWAENHPFGFFSYKCLELSNSSRNGIKIQSWIGLNSIE